MLGKIYSYSFKLITLLPIIFCRQLTKLVPRSKNTIAIGAWHGNLYSDNPKYFAEYLIEHTGFDVTWIGKESLRTIIPVHPRLHFVRKGSIAATLTLLRAKFWVCCIFPYFDLTTLPIDGGAVCINLWHGIPIKRIGQHTIWDLSSKEGQGLRSMLERLYVRLTSAKTQWLCLASGKMRDIHMEAYPSIFSNRKMLTTGSPRIDFLSNNIHNEELISSLKIKYARMLGYDAMKKVVLYLPTWRINSDKPFLFSNLQHESRDRLTKILSDGNAILIEKPHKHTYEQAVLNANNTVTTIIPEDKLELVDTQELLLIANILICDYSSAYLDYAILERPVIHFLYDYERYLTNDMGLAYSIHDVSAGKIVTDTSKMLTCLKNNLINPNFNPGPRLHDLLIYEKGNASQQLVDFITNHK